MSDETIAEFGRALIAEAKQCIVEDSLPRIQKCLGHLSEEDVWLRPNDETTSIGNLILHLCGNVRQWVIAGLGDAQDHRDRASEFADRGPIAKADLLARLENTLQEVSDTLDQLDPASLLEPRRVQGNEVTGITILVHVTEHFSYHTGEITWFVKTHKNVDTGYYAGEDLDITGID